MKVLICGGGCTGPALAYWLVRLGHKVVIVERFPALRAAGAQIDIRAQGIAAVKRMGLLPAIREKLVDEEGVRVIDEKGRAWGTILANKTGKGAQGPVSEFEIMRGDLVRVLYEATKNDVEYIFGKTVESFKQDDKKVEVDFSDGTSDTYDLLVGADGQGSRIRAAMFPDAGDPYLHTGSHVAFWFVPRTESDTSVRDDYHCPGRRQIMRRSHNATETQTYFLLRDKDPSIRSIHRAPEEEQKQFWKDRFSDAGWQAERFIKEMDNTPNWYSCEIVQVQQKPWHKGRVVLLGDAGYCPSPLSGMGTTVGFVGAYVLAGELSRMPHDVPTALKNYDQTLRPFVDKVQDINWEVRKLFSPKTIRGIKTLRWISWLLCTLKVPQLVMRFAPENEGGWALPDYPALVGEK